MESPGGKILKKCQKVREKLWKIYETILPFSCCPLVFPWVSVRVILTLEFLGSQHPSPNVKNPLPLRAQILARNYHITWCQKCLFWRLPDVMFRNFDRDLTSKWCCACWHLATIYVVWRVPNPPGANPLVAERAPWRSSQSCVTGGHKPIGSPYRFLSFLLHTWQPCATPIVTRGEGSFSYQGVSTRGVRHAPGSVPLMELIGNEFENNWRNETDT